VGGFALEQILAACGAEDTYYWASHNGAELDLVLFRRGQAWGVEFKVGDCPTMTKSVQIALSGLKLERAWIVHAGTKTYPVNERVDALPLHKLHELVDTIMG